MTGPQNRLDELLDALPQDMPPERDLWPAIQAQLDERTPQAGDAGGTADAPGRSWHWMRMAAGMLVVVGTSLITFLVTREYSASPPPAPVVQAMPASFGSQALGSEYVTLRSELLEHFQRRMEHLPPPARASLQRSLEDLQRAANDINAILAQHPDDPLLQDLLMSTYQSELQLLADAGGIPGARVDL